MTIREATKRIERVLYPTVHELNKKDPYFAQEIDEAWLLIRRVALTGFKPEEGTTAGLDMPESPNEWENAVSRREHETVKNRLTKVEESIEELKAQMKVWAYD